jgi:hypothetical protein
MLIINTVGGLGNQMFQFAIGRSLSLKYRIPFSLDVSGFLRHNIHQGFELERLFNAPVSLASQEDLRKTLGWQSYLLAFRFLARPQASFLWGNRLIIEPHFDYFDGVERVPSSCYLKGYWQSERYFSDVADAIRADFTFRLPLSDENRRIAETMGAVNAVSLHVRRGDYLSNPHTLSVHGVCSLEYYVRAIHHIVEQVPDPVFFVFSDDLDWVKDALRIEHPCHYVDHNRGSESYNDMRLMSLCRHHIIANSSFSWWGAWLNPSPDKIVVAPSRWFADEKRVTDDLIPKGWVKL